jgi:hypothetical protein
LLDKDAASSKALRKSILPLSPPLLSTALFAPELGFSLLFYFAAPETTV